MKITYSYRSDTGPRPENQDAAAILIQGETALLCVADGLGGHNGGQLAAQTAIAVLQTAFDAHGGDVDLRSAALNAHERIRQLQSEKPSFRQMATTLTAAVVSDGQLRFIHCGDTRLIVQRGKGIRRLTRDHTEAQKLLNEGALTKDQYINYPRKNILDNAIGISKDPYVDEGTFEVKSGDRIFIISDGVYNRIPIRTMKAISDRFSKVAPFVDALMQRVEESGANDNYSICAIFIDNG